ncbi:MAG: hypothetical protein LC772_00220 [Chloroflexi bacterium]|nr:hypothetical protein [Chloroflexota bacterium]
MSSPTSIVGTDGDVWTVRHRVPGRVRLYCPVLRDDAPRAAGIEKAISQVAGVTAVQANPTTGTLLVCYSRERPSLDWIANSVQHSRPCALPRRRTGGAGSTALTSLARWLKNLANGTNQVIRRGTGSRVDFQQVVTVGLFLRACLMASSSGVLSWTAAQGAIAFIVAWTLYQNPDAQKELNTAMEVASPSP